MICPIHPTISRPVWFHHPVATWNSSRCSAKPCCENVLWKLHGEISRFFHHRRSFEVHQKCFLMNLGLDLNILVFWYCVHFSCRVFTLHFHWVEGCRRACTCTDAREAQEASLPCSYTCEMIYLGMCLLHPFPWHRFYLCFITVTFLCNRPEAFAVEHEGSQAEILQVYASVCLA